MRTVWTMDGGFDSMEWDGMRCDAMLVLAVAFNRVRPGSVVTMVVVVVARGSWYCSTRAL